VRDCGSPYVFIRRSRGSSGPGALQTGTRALASGHKRARESATRRPRGLPWMPAGPASCFWRGAGASPSAGRDPHWCSRRHVIPVRLSDQRVSRRRSSSAGLRAPAGWQLSMKKTPALGWEPPHALRRRPRSDGRLAPRECALVGADPKRRLPRVLRGRVRTPTSVGVWVRRFSAVDGRSGSRVAHQSSGTIRSASSNEPRSSDSASWAIATRFSRSHSSSTDPAA
jgi:hypothetical protein